MTTVLARQSDELRAKGDALIKQADKLLCEILDERMWADGEPIHPSPTVDQAISGGCPPCVIHLGGAAASWVAGAAAPDR